MTAASDPSHTRPVGHPKPTGWRHTIEDEPDSTESTPQITLRVHV